MRKKKKTYRALVGILCFFLGFLFAFIFEVGAIVGGVLFIATRDIDQMMDFIGIPNKDSSGDNVYINTDTENGGAKTLLDLVLHIVDAVNDMSTLSIGKISNMVPATDMLLDAVFDITGDYIQLDREAFINTPVTELPTFVVDSVMEIRGSAIMSFIPEGSLGNAESILKALLCGAEAEYATVTGASSVKLPVLYDVYNRSGSTYTRVWKDSEGNTAFPTYKDGTKPSTSWLQSSGTEKDSGIDIEEYRLYYVPCRVTASGIQEANYSTGVYTYRSSTTKEDIKYNVLKFGADTDFIMVKPDANGNFTLNYNDVWAARKNGESDPSERFTNFSYKKEYASSYYYVQEKSNPGSTSYRFRTISGLNYFYNTNGEMVDLWVHTLNDIANYTFEPLESIPVSALAAGMDTGGLVDKLLGKTSLGDLISGNVDFNKIIDDIEISEFIENIRPDNNLMASIIYKISDARDNGDGSWTALYEMEDGTKKQVYVTTKNGYIDKVYKDASKTTTYPGAKIKDLAETSNNIKLDKIIDIDVSNAILCYLGYGVTDVIKITEPHAGLPYEDEDNNPQEHPYQYKGVYNMSKVMEEDLKRKTCYINTRKLDGRDVIDGIWYGEGDEYIAVPPTAINEITGRINDVMDYITLSSVMNVGAEQSLMAYVVYGISDISKTAGVLADGNAYAYTAKYTPKNSAEVTCYFSVKDSDDPYDTQKYINEVWYYNTSGTRQKVFGTKINEVADRAEALMDHITLPSVMKVDVDQMLMTYVAYGVSGVKKDSGVLPDGRAYAYTGKYTPENSTEVTCYITVKAGDEAGDNAEYIDKIWYYDSASAMHEVGGTKIGDVANRAEELMDHITLPAVMDVAADQTLMTYVAYGVSGVKKGGGVLPDGRAYAYTGKYTPENSTEVICYMTVKAGDRPGDTAEYIDEVWYYAGGAMQKVEGTKVKEVADRAEELMDHITLPDVMNVSPDQSLMVYVAYGITGLHEAEGVNPDDGRGIPCAYVGKYIPVGGEEVTCYLTLKPGDDPADSNMYVGEVWYYDGANVRQFISGTGIGDVADRAESLKNDMELGEIINISDDDEKILVSLKHTKISDISTKISSLTVGEIFSEEGIEKSPLLKQLKNTCITRLADEIDEMLIQRIYAGEVYGLPADCDPMQVIDYNSAYKYYVVEEDASGKRYAPVNGDGILTQEQFDARESEHMVYYTYGKTSLGGVTGEDAIMIAGFSENWLYYEIDEESGNFRLTELNVPANATVAERDDAIGNLTSSQFVSGKYYSFGEARGMWRLVLYKKVNIGGSLQLIEKAYSINNFNNMVAVCAANVYTATLAELVDAGIITGVSMSDLNKAVPGQPPLKDMSFQQLINLVIAMAH